MIWKILLALVLLALVLLFLIKPRRRQRKMELLQRYRYAHRGLHNAVQGIPENSLLAFRYALAGDFGAELDVHLTKDNRLVVIHDSDLQRVCGVEGVVEEMELCELRKLGLENTNERIPVLEEVLALFENRTPLIIELKTYGGNYRDLCKRVCRMLESYKGDYCMESFDPRVVWWLRRNEPFIIRGLLMENYIRRSEGKKVAWPLRILFTLLLGNVALRPDFIACRYADRKFPSVRLCTRVLGAQEVSWTIRSQEEMDEVERDNAIPIFEGFLPKRRKTAEAAPQTEATEPPKAAEATK